MSSLELFDDGDDWPGDQRRKRSDRNGKGSPPPAQIRKKSKPDADWCLFCKQELDECKNAGTTCTDCGRCYAHQGKRNLFFYDLVAQGGRNGVAKIPWDCMCLLQGGPGRPSRFNRAFFTARFNNPIPEGFNIDRRVLALPLPFDLLFTSDMLEYLWFVDLWRDLMTDAQKARIETFWNNYTVRIYRTETLRTMYGETIAVPRIRDVFDGVSELTTPPAKPAKRDPRE
jgi:hypothetical protein